MKTIRAEHNTTAFNHGVRSKEFDFNYIENDTALYCFFTNGKHSNNVNKSTGDKIAVRNSNKSSTLKKKNESPMRTTITTIKLFDENQPPSNISSKTSIKKKSTLSMLGKMATTLSKLFKNEDK
jgi:hypothetical protein